GLDDVAFVNDHLERTKGALIDRVERAGQRLVGDARAGKGARIDGGAPLLRATREIDGHRAVVDRDFGADGDRLVAGDAVLIEGGFGLVNAIGELRHHVAAFRFGLVEDAPDRLEQGIAAVFAEQLVHAPRREPARRHLRLHVAERGFRKTDVVLEYAIERLVELTRFVDLELIELQPLDPRVGDGGAGAEAG